MSRRALVVGIDHYNALPPLPGCGTDAAAVGSLLAHHRNGTANFAVRVLTSSPECPVARDALLANLHGLLAQPAEVALAYFAGRGGGGGLVASDGDVALGDLVALADASPVREIVIVIDCAGVTAASGAVLREGVSILTAAGAERGLLSALLCEALGDGAADALGRVTLASVYAYVDAALGPAEPRPRLRPTCPRRPACARRSRRSRPRCLRELARCSSVDDELGRAHERLLEELRSRARRGSSRRWARRSSATR